MLAPHLDLGAGCWAVTWLQHWIRVGREIMEKPANLGYQTAVLTPSNINTQAPQESWWNAVLLFVQGIYP